LDPDDLFASVAADNLRAPAKLFSVRSYPGNAILGSEGDRLQSLNVILAGQIKFF
jgi:hypothetical protein